MKKLIFIYLVFSFNLLSQSISEIDENIFRFINNNQTETNDLIFHNIDKTLWPVSIASPFLIYGIGESQNNNELKETAILLGICQSVSFFERTILKYTIKRIRPFKTLENVNTFNSENLDSYSFPSGHATSAFTLATILSLKYQKKEIAVPLFLWASAIGYARIYNGVHYPSDVIAGAILGSATSYIIYKNQNLIFNLNKKGESMILLPIKNGLLINFSKTF